MSLVAPYCAIPRDYLSDTPLLRAMGFLVSQHGRLGAIPPPPFLSVSPLESSRSGGTIPPPQKGYLTDTGAIPYENKANGCDTPLCDTISKGYCAIWGGISHWAAKTTSLKRVLFTRCPSQRQRGPRKEGTAKPNEEKQFPTPHPRVCKRWFPNGGSSSVGQRISASPGGRFGYFYFSDRGKGRGSPRRQEGAGVGF